MSAVIYYFSGTGNSKVVARDIAEKLNGQLIPISNVMDNENIASEADIIGIVFPVYNAVVQGMPLMVKKFVSKLINLDSKYVFTICTCLGWSHMTIKNIGEIIKDKGGFLSAGFTVIMPDNSSPVDIKKQKKIFKKWEKKREVIYQYIKARKKGRYENPVLLNLIMIPFLSGGKKKTLMLYNKLANTENLLYEEAVNLSDRSFIVNNKCNGCGICASVCPANDIQMIDNIPVWQNRCESCLACVNWCPQEAIIGGIVSIGKIPTGYHHPDVKLSKMKLRNEIE